MTSPPQKDDSAKASQPAVMDKAHRFCHDAMGTTFEIFIDHPDADHARQGARAAFDELDRLEAQLSRFVDNSDISRINNLSAGESTNVDMETFQCLELAAKLYRDTHGAFDITIGPLMKCWLNKDKTLRSPSDEELNLARESIGMDLLKLDEAWHTVTVVKDGVQIDLGGIGKGFAVDRMAGVLGQWKIDRAMIHGGTSSVLALAPPAAPATPAEPATSAPPAGESGWPVTLSDPSDRKRTLARLDLQDHALSTSGLVRGSHIIDPRSARPVSGRLIAWACAADATTADALSTAFIVMTEGETEQYCQNHPKTSALIILDDKTAKTTKRIHRHGPWKNAEFLY
jgi:thiamine biosynthesis lipoprotein